MSEDKEYSPSFKFESLQIWQKAMDLAEDIHRLTIKFPKEEIYNLTSQIKRASDSIALNIAEGSISQTNPEYLEFLGYGIRSLAEVVTCLHKAKRRKYMDENRFMQLYKESFHLMNMMQSFKSKLK
ncbi:four helix bundle protein [Algoriphagus vanfongensis]|uniref:four helix bundle protein n=1 Tax=Algoriphagus vanfongensis TaxID=426371 RepID=UPI000404EF10|nr:four helix bundle protein [Algoriphagus vanfongensis]